MVILLSFIEPCAASKKNKIMKINVKRVKKEEGLVQSVFRFNVTRKTNKRLPAIYTKYLMQDYQIYVRIYSV